MSVVDVISYRQVIVGNKNVDLKKILKCAALKLSISDVSRLLPFQQ